MDDKEALRVGAAVRRRRRALGLTLAAVAARSGLSVPFLSQVENERARPSPRSLDRVADALETTTERLRAAADSARAVDVVRCSPDTHTGAGEGKDGVRRVVRGRHQLSALEFSGEIDLGREFQHRNDELMYVAEGAAEVEAEGQAYRLERGDTLFLSGGVRHRWRATSPGTRLLVVAVAEHIDATYDSRR
ncbi:helix-turn-helix domain-containing protein [Streptomyces sp. DT24]|uniref:helix-turn-helix domain-containing protein n=1 Tax=unclassified Streptomyces TaxID=2593676 RepID=UPI0023BA3491|nr:helix-turn-helix transcriptional regulator [Streptomyces sp. AM 4-1-1]WEH32608.1 helix-turn-helix transcriptional regulator [Streptomyces sp. AM 4-1-1]